MPSPLLFIALFIVCFQSCWGWLGVFVGSLKIKFDVCVIQVANIVNFLDNKNKINRRVSERLWNFWLCILQPSLYHLHLLIMLQNVAGTFCACLKKPFLCKVKYLAYWVMALRKYKVLNEGLNALWEAERRIDIFYDLNCPIWQAVSFPLRSLFIW